ncbi:MAG TPA: DMT family transporter [Brevefilum sp.]|nr:DMT family transporter [Brevefilum sp.]HOR19494.1 DMT family transporter [Brevefilum sp.]HPL69176.1 DMT family transporter [Brevefilum sp.]
MNKKLVGVIAMLIAAVGLAIAVIFMKLIPMHTHLLPQHVAIWRFTIAAPVLWLILLFRKKPAGNTLKRPWWFLVLGVVYAASNFSAVFAVQRLPSSIYVIIFFIYPSLVILYSLLRGSAVPRLVWLGLPLSMVGMLLASIDFSSAFVVDPLGVLITVVNACSVATYMILSEKVFTNVDDKLAGTAVVFTGAMLSGCILIPVLGISAPTTPQGWMLLGSLSIFGTLIPILALNYGLSLLTAARGAIIIAGQPVVNILLGMLVFKEKLTFQQWIGGGLVILAVILLNRSPDRVSIKGAARGGKYPAREEKSLLEAGSPKESMGCTGKHL